MKNHISTILNCKEEKEFTLSLFRIPLVFFSEDNTKINKTINQNTSSTTSSAADTRNIDMSSNESSNISIQKNIDFSDETKNPTTASTTSQPTTPSTTQKNSDPQDNSTPAEEPTNNETTTPSNTTNQRTIEKSTPSSTSPSKPSVPNQPQSNSATQKASDSNSAESNNTASSPTKKNVPNNTDNGKGTNPKDDKPSENDSPNESSEKPSSDKSPDTKPNEKKDSPQDDKPSTSPKDSKSPDTNNDKKDPTHPNLDRYKDKFGNSKPGKKLKDATDNAKKKIGDKVAQSPVASKAMNGINKAKDVKQKVDNAKEAIQNLDTDKIHEAAGDAAVKATSKAVGAVNPAAGKTVEILDKTVGSTETGKKAKKAIGACCCTSSCIVGCILPLMIILIPIIILIQSFSWITNLFSRKDTDMYEGDYEELSEKELEKLKEASLKYSMQEYTDMTINLDNPTTWENILDWVTIGNYTSDYPIQDATLSYIDQNYIFSKEDVEEYNDEYESLIKKGYLMEIHEGDFTSFGTAFENMKSHYTIMDLKDPASAPQSEKELIDGTKKLYTTYDPEGTHQALFEDVLNNMDGPDGLIKRFEGQVNSTWFKEGDEDNKSFSRWLSDYDTWLGNSDYPLPQENPNYWEPDWNKVSLKAILDTKCKVQVYKYDENSFKQLSLRDLFEEVSIAPYDTEYHIDLVRKIFQNGENSKIDTLYEQLTQKLATLELMTYMRAHLSYYNSTKSFLKHAETCANKSMFNDEFWAQFLTFSNIDQYIALASTANHSLAYEIAVISADSANSGISFKVANHNGVEFISITELHNWYATYYFKPLIEIRADNNALLFSMPPDGKPVPTGFQEHLFDKYNVGIEEEENSFFALFEAATGIEFSSYDEEGNFRSPEYQWDKDGLFKKVFPITDSNVQATMVYGQLYSDATVAKYNLTDNVHDGIDYAVPSGTDILATASGTAHVYRGNSGFGNYVKIIHDDGYTSIYAHGNGTFYINNGDRVSAGQLIMQSGNSGNSTGPHLHFEVRNSSGKTVNPTSYIYGNA